jgi:hypothetical protein
MKRIVYLFNMKFEAKEFIKKINEGEGIPKSPESITQTYCEYEEWEGKFYIVKDDMIKKYIESDPIEIEIEIDPIQVENPTQSEDPIQVENPTQSEDPIELEESIETEI